jgi:hypothetical protein
MAALPVRRFNGVTDSPAAAGNAVTDSEPALAAAFSDRQIRQRFIQQVMIDQGLQILGMG